MEWIRGHSKVAVGLALGAAVVVLLMLNWSLAFIGAVAVATVIMLIETGYYAVRYARSWQSWLLALLMVALILAGGAGLTTSLTAPRGNWHTFIIILVVVATDTTAQIVGRRIGEPRTFFASLSPNKTKAGAVAGMIAGTVMALLGALAWHVLGDSIDARVLTVLLVSAPLSIAGDLFESGFKRSLGIKDFGHLLGRSTGGLMDRLDSWLPVFALCLILL